MTDQVHPPSERIEAPLYLARFRERQATQAAAHTATSNGSVEPEIIDDTTPLYLRRFRDRAATRPASRQPVTDERLAGGPLLAETPLWERGSLPTRQALTEDNRNKEISPPPEFNRTVTNDVFLIRHGETQGYSTDSGLTPQGAWQAHGYGHTMARRIKSGETVVFRHADTNRARETAEQIHRGLIDGLSQYEKDVTIVEPAVADEFRNFGFASPDGIKDVTAAFRQYSSLLERFERMATGARPLWLVEMDRFWRTQQGGADPIQHWLTIPMMHFEPPPMCVRRFWAGITRLASEYPGARLAIATHSGPIRAFAVAALGYDPGEPYNTEHVRVKLLERAGQAQQHLTSTIAYRNRVQEVTVPTVGDLPGWGVHEIWNGLPGGGS